MDETGKRPLARLGLENFDGVVVGVAGVDDQRQAGFPRRPDVGAQVRPLRRPRAVLVMVVQTGLADADHPGVTGEFDQPFRRRDGLVSGFVRMNADRAVHVIVSLGDVENATEAFEARADGLEAHDSAVARPRHDGVKVLREVGGIEMAMAVDEDHGAALPALSNRGKMPDGAGSSVPGRKACAAPRWAKSRSPAGAASWSSRLSAAPGVNGCMTTAR